MIHSPEMILADEPGAGDRDAAERLLALLVELNRMGKTVLVATADRALARSLGLRARLLTLARGRVDELGVAA